MLFMFQIDYAKEAEKSKHDYNLPVDAPQFVKAKEFAQNISDVSIILNPYKIFMKMCSSIKQMASPILWFNLS